MQIYPQKQLDTLDRALPKYGYNYLDLYERSETTAHGTFHDLRVAVDTNGRPPSYSQRFLRAIVGKWQLEDYVWANRDKLFSSKTIATHPGTLELIAARRICRKLAAAVRDYATDLNFDQSDLYNKHFTLNIYLADAVTVMKVLLFEERLTDAADRTSYRSFEIARDFHRMFTLGRGQGGVITCVWDTHQKGRVPVTLVRQQASRIDNALVSNELKVTDLEFMEAANLEIFDLTTENERLKERIDLLQLQTRRLRIDSGQTLTWR